MSSKRQSATSLDELGPPDDGMVYRVRQSGSFHTHLCEKFSTLSVGRVRTYRREIAESDNWPMTQCPACADLEAEEASDDS